MPWRVQKTAFFAYKGPYFDANGNGQIGQNFEQTGHNSTKHTGHNSGQNFEQIRQNFEQIGQNFEQTGHNSGKHTGHNNGQNFEQIGKSACGFLRRDFDGDGKGNSEHTQHRRVTSLATHRKQLERENQGTKTHYHWTLPDTTAQVSHFVMPVRRGQGGGVFESTGPGRVGGDHGRHILDGDNGRSQGYFLPRLPGHEGPKQTAWFSREGGRRNTPNRSNYEPSDRSMRINSFRQEHRGDEYSNDCTANCFRVGPETGGRAKITDGRCGVDDGQTVEHRTDHTPVPQRQNGSSPATIHTAHPEIVTTWHSSDATHQQAKSGERISVIPRFPAYRGDDSLDTEGGSREPHDSIHTTGWVAGNGAKGIADDYNFEVLETHVLGHANAIHEMGSICNRRMPRIVSPTNNTNRTNCKLPLHIKRVAPLRERELCKHMSAIELTRYQQVRSFFEEEFLRSVPIKKESKCSLDGEDISQLLEANLIEECEHSHGPALHIFAVEESHKHRRRFIAHTEDINDYTVQTTYKTQFSDIRDIVSTHVNNDPVYVWTNDLAAFYHQIQLDQTVRRYFVFPFGNKHFRLTTIPTGQRHCVERAHCLSMVLARLATGFSPTPAYCIGTVDVYIDDFMFASTEKQVAETAATKFCEVCDNFGVSRNHPAQVDINFQHRGVDFKAVNGAIVATVAEKTRKKIDAALMDCAHIGDWSMQSAQNIFGLLVYCSSICRIKTNVYYYIYKFMRRRTRLLSKGILNHNNKIDARVWPSTYALWSSWLQEARVASRSRDPSTPVYHIVSDASDSGWGAIIFNPNGTTTCCAQPWSHEMSEKHINVKETFAVVFAVRAYVPLASKLHIVVDNTCALYALQKQRSRNFEINLATRLLNDYTIVSACYIASADNPADPLSRSFQ